MYKYRESLSMPSFPLTDDIFECPSCTLQGAALTNSQIFDLYSRGVLPPSNQSVSEGNEIDFDSTIPTDPHEAFQGAVDNFVYQSMVSGEPETVPTSEVSPESPSEAPQMA